jgi:hypothetical protein
MGWRRQSGAEREAVQVSARLANGGAIWSDFPSQDVGPQRSSVRFSPSARFFLSHFIDVCVNDTRRTGLSLCQEPQRGVAVVLQQVTTQPLLICGVESHCELQSPRLMTFYDLLDDEEDDDDDDEEEEEEGAEGESDGDDGGDAVLDESRGAHGMSLDASDVHPSRYKSHRSYMRPRSNHIVSQFVDFLHVSHA